MAAKAEPRRIVGRDPLGRFPVHPSVILRAQGVSQGPTRSPRPSGAHEEPQEVRAPVAGDGGPPGWECTHPEHQPQPKKKPRFELPEPSISTDFWPIGSRRSMRG